MEETKNKILIFLWEICKIRIHPITIEKGACEIYLVMHRWLRLRDFRRLVVLKSFKTCSALAKRHEACGESVKFTFAAQVKKSEKNENARRSQWLVCFGVSIKRSERKRWALSGRNMSDVVLDPSAGGFTFVKDEAH